MPMPRCGSAARQPRPARHLNVVDTKLSDAQEAEQHTFWSTSVAFRVHRTAHFPRSRRNQPAPPIVALFAHTAPQDTRHVMNLSRLGYTVVRRTPRASHHQRPD